MPDPIQPVVDALKSAIAVPSSSPSWKAGKATAASSVVTDISALMQALYGASNDMKDVGNAINSALSAVASVIRALADQIASLGSISDVANAMKQLQQGLAIANTLAPIGSGAVLDSASQLFQQIHDLLASASSAANAANELYQLAQQLEFVGTTLKPS
jgi:hypothetical protein